MSDLGKKLTEATIVNEGEKLKCSACGKDIEDGEGAEISINHIGISDSEEHDYDPEFDEAYHYDGDCGDIASNEVKNFIVKNKSVNKGKQ